MSDGPGMGEDAAPQYPPQPPPPYQQGGYPPPGYAPPPGYVPPPGYAPGQYPYGAPYGYAPPRPTNGMAIASMVLGILWIYWVGSVLALVFGYMAQKEIWRTGAAGGGMATAGIVLGWVGVGFLALSILFFAVATTAIHPR